jgi:SAM-dependent methyltransferase
LVQAAALADEPGLTDPVLEKVRAFYEENHQGIEKARHARRYFYAYLTRVLQSRIPPGQRVLDVGCGSGHLLAALKPSLGVGIDVARSAVAEARRAYPGQYLHFFEGDGADPRLLAQVGGPFDAVVLVNVVTHLTDVQRTLEALRAVCHPRTRVFIYSYSRLWQPVLRLAEILRLKHRPPPDAWLPPEEVRAMLHLADYEMVRHEYQIVFPAYLPLVSDLLNRYVGRLPGIEWLSLMYGVVARPSPNLFPGGRASRPSTSVIIPCRNEAGHIRPLVSRLPDLGPNGEFLFVEGNSTDDTLAVLRQVLAENPTRPFRLLKQEGRGKGDAVRLGFTRARGEVVLILDSDMGVAPEDIPKFVDALVRGKAEMVNGSRMVYPMEGEAMRFLNMLANKAFAYLFSWVLGQQVRDTLCGTKALYRQDYERIAANRAFFGDFDPFGDFDLLFGAARLNLEIVDVAVRYHERRYGQTNISRFRHGWLLLRMSLFAARKLKFV